MLWLVHNYLQKMCNISNKLMNMFYKILKKPDSHARSYLKKKPPTKHSIHVLGMQGKQLGNY